MNEQETVRQQTDLEPTADEKQYVVFNLGQETYGINIGQVREIITMQELTSIPKTAEYMKGIINLRGLVIPVFDLAGKLGILPQGQTKATRIMVVEVSGMTVGMIVDRVSEVLRISQAIVEAPSGVLVTEVSEQFIEGIAKCGDTLVIILNLDHVLVGSNLGLTG